MTSKDEILANFQACSGIDDVGEAFTRLEAANWNLTEAVNSTLGSASGGGLDFAAPSLQHTPEDLMVPPLTASAAAAMPANTATTSSSSSDTTAASVSGAQAGAVGGAAASAEDMLHINIQVLVGGLTGDGVFPLEVPQTTTVGELKSTLYQLLGVTPCKQVLQGFTGPVTDSSVLTSELLGPASTLTVNTTPSSEAFPPYRSPLLPVGDAGDDIMEIGGPNDHSGLVVSGTAIFPKPSTPSLAHTSSNNLSQLPGTSSSSSSKTSSAAGVGGNPTTSSSSSSTNKQSSGTNSGESSSSMSSNNHRGTFSSASSSRKHNNTSAPGASCSTVINNTGSKNTSLKNNSSRNKSTKGRGNNSRSSGSTASTTKHTVDDSDEGGGGAGEGEDSEPQFLLSINDLTHRNEYELTFPGSRTVGSVKQDVSDVTTIPVHRQRWTGWPPRIKDTSTLTLSGVCRTPQLTVSRSSPPASRATYRSSRKGASKTRQSDSDSSSDEFEDAPELLQDDDDTFLEMMEASTSETKLTSLLPADLIADEQTMSEQFAAAFTDRYGSLAPLFFQGPLVEAMQHSVFQPVAQRRLLAVYVHHDGSVMTNVFCSQVLCQPTIVSFMADNFVLWGWDITHPVHRDSLQQNMSRHAGTGAELTVRNFRSEQLPAIILLTKLRTECSLLSVIYASTSSLNEVMSSLIEAVDMFEQSRISEVAEDHMRLSRQAIMNDQNAAYEESLRADRAKAELKRQQEEDEQREVQRQESIRLHEQEMTEKLRASLESQLPPEPADRDSPDVTVMRFRQPGTDQFTRAFTLDTALQVVLNFLHVRGFPADQFKFLQSWPRRDIASLNVALTLKDYNIPQQETITIEER